MTGFFVFINLFFVPVIALTLHYKMTKVQPVFSFKLLLKYAIFAVCNTPLTEMFIMFIRKLSGKNIFINSAYYTLLALLAAIVLPFLLKWIKKIYRGGSDWLHRILRKEKNGIVFFVLAILTVICSLIPYCANLSKHKISVEVLENGNENRKNSEIKIDRIIVDGKPVAAESILTQGGWFIAEDGLFTWRDHDFPEGMERIAYGEFQAAKNIELYFQANVWRGAARVTVDGESQVIDCFFDSTVQKYQKSCAFEMKGYDRFRSILLLRNFLIFMLLMLFAIKVVCLTKNKNLKGERSSSLNGKQKRIKKSNRNITKNIASKIDSKDNQKNWFSIVAVLIVLLTHAFITFSEQKLVSNLPETSIEITPVFFYVRLAFLLVMFCLVLILAFSKQLQIQNEEKMYYWICIGIVLCSLCIRYPVKTWQSEPYWESCSNLIWQTYERGPAGSILLDDSGYWTLLPRLIVIVVLFLVQKIEYAACVTQFLVVLLFVFITAKIIKKEFSDYFNAEIRFVIALLLGTTPFISHLQILNLHNIGYYAIALMLLCCISDLEKVSWPVLILDIVITVLACCSKVQGIVILPILILILIGGWKFMKRKEKVFYCSCLWGCLMMCLYILSGVAEGNTLGGVEKNIPVLIGATLRHIIQTFLFFIKPINEGGYWGGCIINGALVVTLFICLHCCICKFSRRSVICFSLLLYMSGCALLMALSFRLSFQGIEDFLKATSIYSDRNNFPLVFSALLFLLVFLSGQFVFFTNKKQFLCLFLLLLVLRFSFTPVDLNACVNTNESLNWQGYSTCLDKNTFGLPGLNNGFFILKNAKVYYYGNSEPDKFDGHFYSGVSGCVPLEETQIDGLSLGETRSVVSVYTEKRYLLPEEEHITLELWDSEGHILQQVDAIGERDRYAIGFILDEPLDGVTSISFVNKDTGEAYFVSPNIYVVVEAPNRGMSADAGWGASSLEE